MVPPFAANLQVLLSNRTVFDGGGIAESSPAIRQRQLADTARRSWISVFWTGHNNVSSPEQIKADIAASIAGLAPGNDRFLVLSLVNQATPAGIRGGAEYAIVTRLNNELAALYPNNFLDVRAALVQAYNRSDTQDAADFANDVPPSSLRYDEVHLRNEGSVLVATMTANFIEAKGW